MTITRTTPAIRRQATKNRPTRIQAKRETLPGAGDAWQACLPAPRRQGWWPTGERNGAYRTGRYSAEAKADRREQRALIRDLLRPMADAREVSKREMSGAVPRDQLEAFKRDVLGPRPNDLVIRIRRFRGERGDPQPRHVATHAGR
jgi:hypothetical protein